MARQALQLASVPPEGIYTRNTDTVVELDAEGKMSLPAVDESHANDLPRIRLIPCLLDNMRDMPASPAHNWPPHMD